MLRLRVRAPSPPLSVSHVEVRTYYLPTVGSATTNLGSQKSNAYRKQAVGYYRKDGKSTGTEELLRPILRLVKDLYGKESTTGSREWAGIAAIALPGGPRKSRWAVACARRRC